MTSIAGFKGACRPKTGSSLGLRGKRSRPSSCSIKQEREELLSSQSEDRAKHKEMLSISERQIAERIELLTEHMIVRAKMLIVKTRNGLSLSYRLCTTLLPRRPSS